MLDKAARDLLPTGAHVVLRGDVWTVEARTQHSDCDALRVAGVSGSNTGSVRTFLLPFDRVATLESRREPRVVRTRAWNRHVLAVIAGTRSFGSVGAAASANIEILPFQLEPALAMLRHGHTRILIADEVGLGKTIQAGLVIAELSAENDAFRAMVLTPASLGDQWVRELRERFRLETTRTDGGWLSTRSRALPPDVNPWSLPGISVASLDLVKRPEVLRALEDVTWDVVVVDEAHTAGMATARLAAAHAIATRARRVLLLTATPPDGDPPQFAALTGIGSLGDPILQFRRSRSEVGQPARRRTMVLQVRLSSAERRMHRLLARYTTMLWAEAATRVDSCARLTATLLRKRALSSAASLASSVQRRLALLSGTTVSDERQLRLPLGDEGTVEDDVADLLLGAPGLADQTRERAVLGRIEKLALSASRSESKIDVLLRLIRRVRQPAIVFTEYRDTLSRLAAALRSAGHAPLLLHGGMALLERAESLRSFDQQDSLLLATDAASEGLNLHRRCRLVIHFELPWTPARLEQRTGRVDRLGQRRTVHEVLFVARDTAERIVLVPLLRRARAAANSGARGNVALLAMTESLVAEGVIGGEPVSLPVRDTPADASSGRLVPEAEEEACRAGIERRAEPFRVLRSDAAGCVTALRRRNRAVLTLVVEVRLRHQAGRTVHSRVLGLQLDAPWNGDRRARALRSFVASLAREWTSIIAAVERYAGDSVRTAERHHATATVRLQQRDKAMLETLPSAARRLVQAGLFDRRAVRAMERARRAATLIVETAVERSEVATASGELERIVTLIGVRVGHPT